MKKTVLSILLPVILLTQGCAAVIPLAVTEGVKRFYNNRNLIIDREATLKQIIITIYAEDHQPVSQEVVLKAAKTHSQCEHFHVTQSVLKTRNDIPIWSIYGKCN